MAGSWRIKPGAEIDVDALLGFKCSHCGEVTPIEKEKEWKCENPKCPNKEA